MGLSPQSAFTTCGIPWRRRIPVTIHRKGPGLGGVHMCADDPAGSDVDHGVGIDVGAAHRPGESVMAREWTCPGPAVTSEGNAWAKRRRALT